MVPRLTLGYDESEGNDRMPKKNVLNDPLVGPLVDEYRVAKFLKSSVRTVQKGRLDGTGPPFYKLGRSVRYSLDEVGRWVAKHRRRSTSG